MIRPAFEYRSWFHSFLLPYCMASNNISGDLTIYSYRYGQLSGMVEPIAGILGCIAVSIAEPLLPYALAFAAGAMIFVVVDDVIPEAQTW